MAKQQNPQNPAGRSYAPSNSVPPLPTQPLQPDPLAAQMASDLRFIRRKQSIEVFSRGIGTLIVLGFIAFVFIKGFVLP